MLNGLTVTEYKNAVEEYQRQKQLTMSIHDNLAKTIRSYEAMMAQSAIVGSAGEVNPTFQQQQMA
jgi:hypothetical protein